MTEIPDNLLKIREAALAGLQSIVSAAELESWRVQYIGRKGVVPQFLRTVSELPLEDRKQAGATANELRQELEQLFQDKKSSFGAVVHQQEKIHSDLEKNVGHIHPLSLTMKRIIDIFCALGFEVVETPEVEEQQYNFDLLNISKEHPARAETDTFFLAEKIGSDTVPLILRTHVSPAQIRGPLQQSKKPPYKIVYVGRTFRPEKADATHESVFHQFEFMVVSETTCLADLKGVMEAFYSTFFGKKITTRLRPSYFPFVEPGVEVDISCVFCEGAGCNVCKHTGWIEIAGAGMVHPSVLKNVGIDPEIYQGFASGGGVDRLAMLRYGVNDVRLFLSGDIRFLKQFS